MALRISLHSKDQEKHPNLINIDLWYKDNSSHEPKIRYDLFEFTFPFSVKDALHRLERLGLHPSAWAYIVNSVTFACFDMLQNNVSFRSFTLHRLDYCAEKKRNPIDFAKDLFSGQGMNVASSELETCAICHDDENNEDGGCVKLRCSHVFHGDCIAKWFVRNGVNTSCPMCRANIWLKLGQYLNHIEEYY